LHCFKYFQRKCRCSSGDVSCHHDCGAEFADGTGKSEYDSGNDAARSERKSYRKEDASIASAECSRDLFKTLIDILKPNAGGTHQKRKRHNSSGDDNGAPGENNVDPQLLMQKLTERSATAEEF